MVKNIKHDNLLTSYYILYILILMIIDGKEISKKLIYELETKIKQENIKPNLFIILIGNNKASEVYIKNKKIQCEKIGINCNIKKLEYSTNTSQLIDLINNMNNNINVYAYIIQLPLPDHIDQKKIFKKIDTKKDVDCFHPENIGNIILNNPKFFPATPYGICLLLDHYNIKTEGQNITIIGKSNIVGNPLSLMLSNENNYKGTVTLCDKYTNNLNFHVESSDILIVAAGVHHLINNKFKVKETSVLIDVGIHRIEDKTKKSGYKLEGDIDYNYFLDKCAYITPVPGGVGPMTVYSLLYNCYLACLNN